MSLLDNHLWLVYPGLLHPSPRVPPFVYVYKYKNMNIAMMIPPFAYKDDIYIYIHFLIAYFMKIPIHQALLRSPGAKSGRVLSQEPRQVGCWTWDESGGTV